MRMLAIALMLLCSLPAAALDDYVLPDHVVLAQTLVRLKAVNLADDAVLDEYARLAHCPLFQGLYDDEFTWNDVRPAMRASVAQNIADFPMQYAVMGSVALGRYDFDQNGFRFRDPGTMENLGFLELTGTEAPRCGGDNYRYFPSLYRVRLRRPVTLRLVPMSPDEADRLREYLVESGNRDRILTIRFNISIIDVADRTEIGRGPSGPGTTLLANPDSIDLFADREMTVPIYTYLRDEQRQTYIPAE